MRKLIMSTKQRDARVKEYELKIEELEKDIQKYVTTDSIKYLQAIDGIEFYKELIQEIRDYNKKR